MLSICHKYNICFPRCVLDDSYVVLVKKSIKGMAAGKADGLSDSVRQLLMKNDPIDKHLLNLLLSPF